MENLKIRIPCEEVSKLVQEKAFEKGYSWAKSKRVINNLGSNFIYLEETGSLLKGMNGDYFITDLNKEISWQEWVYGEGYFFISDFSDKLFYQSKNLIVYWINDCGFVEYNDGYSKYKQHIGDVWHETDMFGNKLEEKEMVKLYEDKINVELTAYQVATIKALFGGLIGSEDGVYFKMREILPNVGHISFDIDMDVRENEGFKECVELILSNNGYVKEAPKPVKEMSLADVCKELGYDVKIIKE